MEHTLKWSYRPKYTFNSNRTQIFIKTMIVYFHESFQSKDRILPVLGSYTFSHYRNTHIPNIHALNSDTHTLFLSILILSSQCVGVAIEGNDIWYMGLIYYVWLNVLFGNNFWNHHNFVHTKSITEYKLFGNKITDYHHPRLYHYRSYYYRLVVLLFSTNTESSITNINYDVLFVSRTVLLRIRYITNKSYYRIDYHRFVLLLNIPITV